MATVTICRNFGKSQENKIEIKNTVGKLDSTLDIAEEIVHEKETKFKKILRLKY